MTAESWTALVGERAVSVTLDRSGRENSPAFVMAHGAGGRMNDRGMRSLAKLLSPRGLHVVRFNFPYAETGSRRPDPMPLLQACTAAVVASAKRHVKAARWLIGGRSMGGRAASMLAADGFACDGLLLLAFPLHPAGEPAKLRDAHLPRIRVPTLCVNGTRDALCRRDLMDAVVARLPSTFSMHWLEGADHSFHVLKSSGRSDADVLDEIGTTVDDWLRGFAASARSPSHAT